MILCHAGPPQGPFSAMLGHLLVLFSSKFPSAVNSVPLLLFCKTSALRLSDLAGLRKGSFRLTAERHCW